ncbi:MAG: sulfatase-like hydrolase/transferase [Candidatus Pseudobacter hemicellulosilyticus]|uniref:Sulfatase-like hydrolase/transferase n=1 Tax=Candidatus Pseudobacter hemicellulosilyticus TaxID=3121375 RepID=A0AAJ6BGY5_9BACT|nr:MAG: sulfatase-like hydrolase/transferase [Pseudobacter sp.]
MTNPLPAQDAPARVIVFLIDGLHWQAPDKLKMPVFNQLVREGAYIQRSCMITPHHPTVGAYGQLHTSSFPNPVLQAGTLFVRPENKMLQEMFSDKQPTAFVANTKAYTSVSKGFTINIHDPLLTDSQVLAQSLDLLRRQDISYFRIHLQTPGNEGRYLTYTSSDKPYYRNIWGQGSPYVHAIEEADRLLGELVGFLKSSGKWENTLLIVSSDQGQSNKGWHPMIEEDSWTTPLLFVGKGIAKGRTLPYFEHTDLTPTIAQLMQVKLPNQDGGTGVAVKEILEGVDPAGFFHPQYIKTINQQINEYNGLRARIMIAAEKDSYFSNLISYLENELLTPEPFYHQDRFTEWYKAGTVAHLVEVNRTILAQMKKEQAGANP